MNMHLPLRQKLLASLITATVAAAVTLPAVSWAQTADANLRGKAPAGSTVTARNVATGAVRVTRASGDGSYALIGLPPGTYQVDAGAGTQQTVTLTVASTPTLDLTAPAAAAPPEQNAANLGEVTVSAATLTEVKTPENGGTISLHQIDNLPQITRNFLEFADTVPGMVFSVDSSGHTKLVGGAQNANSVNVYIDGVGQKNYVKEGGVSGQFATQGNPFPQLAIGEYKVITSNYKAEYDQISSAAVVAGTKSGTNEFHGTIFGNYTDQDWRRETPSEENSGNKTQSKEKDFGVAIGGPIIKDMMHFFFTYEGKRYNTPKAVTPGYQSDSFDITSLLPADVQSQFGPSGLPFKENLYFGKIDFEPNTSDRFELSSKVRKEDQADNIGAGQAVSSSIDTKNNDTRVDLRWQHSADAWYNEAILSYEKTFNAPVALSNGNGAIYTWYNSASDNPTIIDTGPASPLATQNKGQKGWSFKDDLTFNDLQWHGDHVIKAGIKYKKVKLTAQDADDANPQFYYDVTPDGTADTPWKVFFPSPVPGLSPVATSQDKQLGLYIQDDWDVNDKLQLNLGLRWDYEDNPSYSNYVTPANVIAALNGPNPDPNAPAGQTYAQALALGGIDVNDYISNGHNRGAFDNEWQPRFGFSYDFNGDEMHVLHGGIGRAYDRDLYDYLQLEITKFSLPQFTFYFPNDLHPCSSGSQCITWDPKYLQGLENLQSLVAASNAGAEIDALNNHLKAPYSDQFSLGVRNSIGEWNTDATISRIISKDGFVFTLGNRYPNGAFWMNGGQPWGNGVPGFGSLIVGNNGIETRSTSLLLSAEKPYTRESGWSATIAYTYTNAKQNRDINEHYSFDEATIQDYPFIDSNAVAKHRLVASAIVDLPWEITFSGKLTLATPMPVNSIACYGATFPNGSGCTPIAATPPGQKFLVGGHIFGYRDIDFQLRKDFTFGNGMAFYGTFDIINAFNFKNYTDVLSNWGSDGVANPNPVHFDKHGNIVGEPRLFRLEVGFTF